MSIFAPCVVGVPLVVTRDGCFPGPVSLAVDGLANGVKASFDPAQATFPNGAALRAHRSGGDRAADRQGGAAHDAHDPCQRARVRRAHSDREGERHLPRGIRRARDLARDNAGVQSQSLPQRDSAFPRAPITYAEVPGAVRLRRDGTAVVRVYANLAYGPSAGAPNVPMLLYGNYYDDFGQRKAYPESPLTPVSGLRTLKTGPG